MDTTPRGQAERESTSTDPKALDPKGTSIWPFGPGAPAPDHASVTLCSGMHERSPAVLIATPSHVVFVSMHGGVARRVMSLGIRHVVLVDETATSSEGSFGDVTVLAARATITLTHVDRQRAVDFCNAVRLAILYEAAHRDSSGGRGAPAAGAKARRPAASEKK